MSPTARTLVHLRKEGYTAAVVEKWNPHARRRQDLFGFGDIIGLGDGTAGCFMVQACAGSSHAARKAKLLAEPLMAEWLRFGNRVYLMSWSKTVTRNKDGGKAKVKRWTLRKEALSLPPAPATDAKEET